MPRAATLRSFAHPPWRALFVAAGCGLVLSACGMATATVPLLCRSSAISELTAANAADAVALAIALNPPGPLMAGWALMLLAMMPPLLAAPLMHVWRSSLPQRRQGSLALFLIGYCAVWMAAGPPLIVVAVALHMLGGGSLWVTFSLVIMALVWSACPWQRAMLNRGHRQMRISLFGWAAAGDCVRYGVVHAIWCVASCWPWMLAAVAVQDWHLAAMMAVGAIMLGERLAPPEPPRWRWPALLRAIDPRSARAPLQGLLRHG
ncbi:DUF2182 domain-containing protein [Bradyrhizobium sp. SRS-191]|uniref:DUF2182 domain-containing protein n=1 Tax=Bradyrhizobium sp. SRS-191 TaxID=2962606 RepID=UPI00211DF95C|nr:DUF2182 domain-containing protein [Bradyrhizobium sp. SRS-191]